MKAVRLVHRAGWAPVLLALASGCLVLGGQTGEDSAPAHATGGGPVCGPPQRLAASAASRWGFSGEDLLEQYAGTWSGSVRTQSGATPAALRESPVASPYPLAFTIEYEDGEVLASDCVVELTIEVSIALNLGDGIVSRTGSATLEGNLDEGRVELELPASSNDALPQSVSLLLTLDDEGGATGVVSTDDWWAAVEATRAP